MDYIPHAVCLRSNLPLIALHLATDILIALSYFVISVALAGIVVKGKWRSLNMPPSIVFVFANFILSCGITHIMDAWVIYDPAYVMQGIVKTWTAISSMLAAVIMLVTWLRIDIVIAEAKRSENARSGPAC